MKSRVLCALFLAFVCYVGENLSVNASGAIKKTFSRKPRSNSVDISEGTSDVSFPKSGRCEAIGDYIAGKKSASKYLHKFVKCLIEYKDIPSENLHDKYTKISSKCAKFGHRASESTKVQPLSCVFCYKEILVSLKNKYSDINQIIQSEYEESIAHIYIIVMYLEKFLRAKLSVISKNVISTDWFSAYSNSREFCGTLTLVFEYWNRVVRDTFWPYLNLVSDNYYSRFTVENQCPYSTVDIQGVKISEDKELTAILENPLSFS
ncbi:hypothetical protein OIY81_1393 [Cryptosporidium canis]|uniref:Uncharacterized protein n=1 Tax=Cryptosporidium canis TaxID=195482 RepID=A0ABQ8P6P5_9CRYT|nr:hypothetical protein OJ252_2217 [Cryptosporidium canis]KAJ1612157.1 hypothetical protein OIY81_1393 [Cryptosporidium canis]